MFLGFHPAQKFIDVPGNRLAAVLLFFNELTPRIERNSVAG